MFGDKKIVNNRVFLLGLDKLYRKAMKVHEVGELLPCAQKVAHTLEVPPASVPIEGYYTESPELEEYFRLVRALQEVQESSKPKVADLSEFRRILEVVSSPIFGEATYEGKLLPTGQDPLSQALEDSKPNWAMDALVLAANEIATERDDYSLVGLAARSKDAVVLTATRESVVLYARTMVGSARQRPRYVWQVDKELSEAAARFIETFNKLFNEKLPAAKKKNAEIYWHACKNNDIYGRCVRIGFDDTQKPMLHYHWAIGQEEELVAHEFWRPEIWTTEMYSDALEQGQVPL